MTNTEKGYASEAAAFHELRHRGHQAIMTPYHWPYDILVAGICKIEVKFSLESKDGFEFCLPELIKSDIIVLMCEGWHTFVIPSNKIEVHHLRINRKNIKYLAYIDRYDLVSQYVHAVQKLSRQTFSDGLRMLRG